MIEGIYWITWRELKRYFNSKVGILIRFIQPLVWLGFTGNIFSETKILLQQVGFLGTYLDYIAPGVVTMMVLFTSIFGGMTTLLDRRLGYMNRILASPISRTSIALGKVLGISLIALIQSGTLLGIALFLGIRVSTGILGIFAIILTALVVALGFSSISLMVAIKVKSHEAFWGVVNFMGMPLLFVSSALFPLELMPSWLADIAKFNPLTYSIDIMRFFMAPQGSFINLIPNLIIIGLFALIVVSFCAILFNREITKAL
ncbi:MAG: ABC transporter permease [Nitrososphaerales archaeon]